MDERRQTPILAADEDRDAGAPDAKAPDAGGDVTAGAGSHRPAGASRPLEGEELTVEHGLFDLDHFHGARPGAGPAEPAAAPDSPPGEEEQAEAGLRPDSSGLRHEQEIKPRR